MVPNLGTAIQAFQEVFIRDDDSGSLQRQASQASESMHQAAMVVARGDILVRVEMLVVRLVLDVDVYVFEIGEFPGDVVEGSCPIGVGGWV